MLEPIHKSLRKLALSIDKEAYDGTPYENISIFLPQTSVDDVKSYGSPSETEHDDNDNSKWKSDMRRQGPYPPLPDILESGYSGESTVNSEFSPGIGIPAEGPRTDLQGKSLRSLPADDEIGIDDPNDLNRETVTPAGPDDLGSAI